MSAQFAWRLARRLAQVSGEAFKVSPGFVGQRSIALVFMKDARAFYPRMLHLGVLVVVDDESLPFRRSDNPASRVLDEGCQQ